MGVVVGGHDDEWVIVEGGEEREVAGDGSDGAVEPELPETGHPGIVVVIDGDLVGCGEDTDRDCQVQHPIAEAAVLVGGDVDRDPSVGPGVAGVEDRCSKPIPDLSTGSVVGADHNERRKPDGDVDLDLDRVSGDAAQDCGGDNSQTG